MTQPPAGPGTRGADGALGADLGADGAAAARATRDAALALLEPLAGLLLSRQLRFAEAEDLLKAAYVQASARAFAAQGKLPTVSTLSVATGIRRREVKRLLEQTEPDATARTAVRPTAAAQVRLRWATDPAYLDDAGQPRRLPRLAPPGEPSFAALAASVSKDTHARAVLDELVRLGVAEEDGDTVTLRQRDWQPSQADDERLRIAGANVGDHLSAVLINLLSGAPPLLERAVFATGLTRASAQRGAELAREVWRDALPALRTRLQALADQDAAADDNGWRTRIGLFAYYAPESRPAAPVHRQDRPRRKGKAAASPAPAAAAPSARAEPPMNPKEKR